MKHLPCKALPIMLCLLLCACGLQVGSPTTAPPTGIPTTATTEPMTTAAPTAPPDFVFTRENMPRLDGSTSTAPLAEAVCSVLLGESREAIADLVRFNKTTTAYYNLINGYADMLIVGEDNAEILEEKASKGFEWERAAFATDAFIFVVNESNPIDSITIDQAKRIYTGEITNWSELGGEDREIVAFQRNSDAGSQNLMEKLVMQGTPMMDAPTGYVVATMGDLMTAVKSYDGSPGAIGYTVYYYAQEMKMARGLKILALEGVTPNPETIRSEQYPLLNPKYVVIPADAPVDAPNRILFNWLLGAEGQELVASEGYVAIIDQPTADSQLLPAVGTRWYDEYTDTLIPRDDYGDLIPYAGLRLHDNWPAVTGCMYGLMTKDGVAVTDAVYSNVTRPSYNTQAGRIAHPLLALYRGGSPDDARGVTPSYAIASLDGSWCTDFSYNYLRSSKDGLLLFSDDSITVMSPTGEIMKSWAMADIDVTEEDLEKLFDGLHWYEGGGGTWIGDYLVLGAYDSYTTLNLLHLPTGVKEVMSIGDWDAYAADRVEWYSGPSEAELVALLPPGDYYGVEFYYDGFTYNGLPGLIRAYQRDDNTAKMFSPDGTPLTQFTQTGAWYSSVKPVGGLIEVLDLNTASYYDPETLECVFRTYLGFESD